MIGCICKAHGNYTHTYKVLRPSLLVVCVSIAVQCSGIDSIIAMLMTIGACCDGWMPLQLVKDEKCVYMGKLKSTLLGWF